MNEQLDYAQKATIAKSISLGKLTAGKGAMKAEHTYADLAEVERLLRNADPAHAHQDALRPRYRRA